MPKTKPRFAPELNAMLFGDSAIGLNAMEMYGNNVWRRYVPYSQHHSLASKKDPTYYVAIFQINLRQLEEKLGIQLLTFKSKMLHIPCDLTVKDIATLALILSQTNIQRITFEQGDPEPNPHYNAQSLYPADSIRTLPKYPHVANYSELLHVCLTRNRSVGSGSLLELEVRDEVWPVVKEILPCFTAQKIALEIFFTDRLPSGSSVELAQLLAFANIASLRDRSSRRHRKAFFSALSALPPLERKLTLDTTADRCPETLGILQACLSKQPAITVLKLISIEGMHSSADAFFSVLPDQITELYCPDVFFSTAAFSALVNRLPQMRNLRVLDLNWSFFENDDANAAISLLADQLGKADSPPIEVLNLHGIRATNFDPLAQVLHETKIHTLDISRHHSQPIGIVVNPTCLLQALQHPNCPLKRLNLENIRLGEHYMAFITMIPSLTNLEYLNLHLCHPRRDEEAIATFSMLPRQFAYNFTIINQVGHYPVLPEIEALIKLCSERNTALHQVRTVIDRYTKKYRDSLPTTLRLLEKDIEAARPFLEAARGHSLALQELIRRECPGIHNLCISECEKLRTELDGIFNDRIKPKERSAARAVQAAARGFFARRLWSDSREARDLVLARRVEFVGDLAQHNQWKTLKEFSAAMERQDYIKARRLLEQHTPAVSAAVSAKP